MRELFAQKYKEYEKSLFLIAICYLHIVNPDFSILTEDVNISEGN